MHKLEENIKCETGVGPLIPNATAAQTGNAVSLAKYNNFALGCQLTDHASGGIGATFYIAQGTNSTQFSTSYLATCTLASNTTTDQSDVIEVRAEELSDGYTHVRGEIVMAATNTVQEVAALNIRFNPRFAAV